MYILVEGLLFVYADFDGTGKTTQVGRLTPGQFFGEMSLLTGEPRSATIEAATSAVVYEVTKRDLETLIEARPEIAETITQVVAQRRTRNLKARDQLGKKNQEEETKRQAFQMQFGNTTIGAGTIALAVGGVLVLGGLTYFVLRKRRK